MASSSDRKLTTTAGDAYHTVDTTHEQSRKVTVGRVSVVIVIVVIEIPIGKKQQTQTALAAVAYLVHPNAAGQRGVLDSSELGRHVVVAGPLGESLEHLLHEKLHKPFKSLLMYRLLDQPFWCVLKNTRGASRIHHEGQLAYK